MRELPLDEQVRVFRLFAPRPAGAVLSELDDLTLLGPSGLSSRRRCRASSIGCHRITSSRWSKNSRQPRPRRFSTSWRRRSPKKSSSCSSIARAPPAATCRGGCSPFTRRSRSGSPSITPARRRPVTPRSISTYQAPAVATDQSGDGHPGRLPDPSVRNVDPGHGHSRRLHAHRSLHGWHRNHPDGAPWSFAALPSAP
jgi:hypothetical protein